MRWFLLPCLGLLLWGGGLAAQTGEGSMRPGTLVRIRAPETAAKRVAGKIVYLDADSLVLERSRETLVVPTRAIESLEVSDGRDRMGGLGRGLIWGLVPGGVLGYSAAASYGAKGGWKIGVAGIGAGAGSVVGGLIGAALGVQRWKVDPSWPRVGVAAAPGRTAAVQASWKLP